MSAAKEKEKEKGKEKGRVRSWLSGPFAARRGSQSHSEQEGSELPRSPRPIDVSNQSNTTVEGTASASGRCRASPVSHPSSPTPVKPSVNGQRELSVSKQPLGSERLPGSTQLLRISEAPRHRETPESSDVPRQRQLARLKEASGVHEAQRPRQPPGANEPSEVNEALRLRLPPGSTEVSRQRQPPGSNEALRQRQALESNETPRQRHQPEPNEALRPRQLPVVNEPPRPRQPPGSYEVPRQRQPPGSKEALRPRQPSPGSDNVSGPRQPSNNNGTRAGAHAIREAKSCWEAATLSLQVSHPAKFEILQSASKAGPLKEEEFRNVLEVSSGKQNESKRLPLGMERIWQALQPFQQIGLLAARADPHMIAPYAVASLFVLIRVLHSNHGEDCLHIRVC
jgi:hypothetical protein